MASILIKKLVTLQFNTGSSLNLILMIARSLNAKTRLFKDMKVFKEFLYFSFGPKYKIIKRYIQKLFEYYKNRSAYKDIF